jgi:hypothetical protein
VAEAFCEGEEEQFEVGAVGANGGFLALAVDERDAGGGLFARSGVDREKAARGGRGGDDATAALLVAGQIFVRLTVFFPRARAAVSRDARPPTVVHERAALTERTLPGRWLLA